MSYYVGNLVRATGTFTNAAGTATDPSVVRCKYRDPSGNVTSLLYGTDAALVKSATGIYYVDIDADELGVWNFRFYSTGTGQAANEDTFTAIGTGLL
jgi:hypothetical protein